MKEICQTRWLATYEAPEAEVLSMDVECRFLFDSFTGGDGRKAADDLGDVDTDAGNAIWK